MRPIRTMLPATLLLVTLAGCASQRALPMVRAAGNESYWDADYETARANYQEYVDRKPEDVQGRVDLGRTLLAMGRPSEAREHLIVAYDREPTYPDLADLLARAMVEAGEPERAEIFLTRRAQEVGRWQDYLLLGRYHTLIGKPDEARASLVTAARLAGPSRIEPQMALAEMYRSLKDPEREIQRLRMALWIEPENPRIADRLRELGQVPGPTFAIPPTE